jgi:hypothetical protein
MKKLASVLVLIMSVLIVNAQETKTSTTKKSPETTTTTTTTKTTAKPATPAAKIELPKAVTDNIEKSYPGYTVKEVKDAKGKDGADYEVFLHKGNSKETLYYTKDGKMVKQVNKSESKKK